MINLRFHIVSIVAIFLALAIGMLAGSTLLDRATVDVLQGRQRSLDARNTELRAENDELRAAIDAETPGGAAFGNDVISTLVPGLLTDSPVLVIAVRGIDEDTVRATQAAIRDAGGSPLGIVWLDERLDLDVPDTARQVAASLGLEPAPGREKQAIVGELAGALEAASVVTTTTTTTTTAPPLPGGPTAPDTPGAGDDTTVPGDDPALTLFSRLVDADLVDWESPTEGEPGSRTLPAGGLDVVVLSGEGASLRPGRIVYPLIRSLASRTRGVLVGEVRRPRTLLDAVDEEGVPVRGSFVDPLRADDDLAARIITVDNVDEPFGRLAAVLALAELPSVTSGSYGIAASAEQPFPTPDS